MLAFILTLLVGFFIGSWVVAWAFIKLSGADKVDAHGNDLPLSQETQEYYPYER